MNLTYYSLKPISIKRKCLTVIDIGNVKVYWDFIQGLNELNDSIKTSTDDLELKDPHQLCTFYGDLLTLDLNKVFERKVSQHVVDEMSQEEQVKLIDMVQGLNSQLLNDLFVFDLPLMVEIPSITDIIKLLGLRLDSEVIKSPFEKTETLIKVLVELGIDRTPIILNASHYLTKKDINQFCQVISYTDLSCIFIEFSENQRKSLFENADYYYIDPDFMLWHK
ncbi:type II-A CRISPR-associated protein Csn2 [Secundilactobacillus paracollinoides]|uniref:Type II-A CRISPR-associated protein Csn2 n=1 Tax=Secundilactobacillus paracollinoides TaxID=240427 RepID=A0A1B2IXX0_9LACO|nr:type II-A CRISPR-associated protein Csn2 [Secundilactobacillus paracollinoides]ANZ60991.1 hypothetical protein AYR61_06300 [Secundilactobacillus paracollinoides]ANZ66848.1 hypothetical protein AYR63_06660 [Secundilactobacillus paracollinoides]